MSGKVTPKTVLVDTNVIFESDRTGSWRALVGGHQVETVEDCVTETQTGFQRREPERLIDVNQLRASLACVHQVSDRQRGELTVLIQGIALDRGEESLWAHALVREDMWYLCGPDRASLRCGVRLGFRERMVSLEQLLDDVGYHRKIALKTHYTKKWLEKALLEVFWAERSVAHDKP